MKTVKWLQMLCRYTGPLLGLFAFLVYFAGVADGAAPGRAAALVVQYTGLFPRLSAAHPIWSAIVSAVNSLPVGMLAWKMNLLSAVFGGLCVWVLNDVVREALRSVWRVTPSVERRAFAVTWLAGAVSALALAFSSPFWVASTSADTITFDALLLLVVLRLLVSCVARPYGWRPMLLAFMCGASIVEFPTVALFAPLVLVLLLAAMVSAEILSARYLGILLALFVAGTAFYFIAAGLFIGTEGYQLRGYRGYWHLLYVILRDQYVLLSRGLPRVGWLLVLLTSVVPWAMGLMVARRGLNEKEDWSFFSVHAVMTAVALVVILNAPIAPWPLLGGRQMLITPYVLATMLTGYLVAFWIQWPFNLWGDSEEPWKIRLRPWVGCVLALPIVVAVAAAPFRNAKDADSSQAEEAGAFARRVVSMLDDGAVLVTRGNMDGQFQIAAAEQGKIVRVLNTGSDDNDLYRRYVAAGFTDPEIRSFADIGVGALVNKWLSSDTGAVRRASVFLDGTTWQKAGLLPVPDRLVYRGARKTDILDTAALMERHRTFWDEFGREMRIADRARKISGMHVRILHHTGKIANDLGVFMEERGELDNAFECYLRARELDPLNVSALYNMLAMVERGYKTPEKDRIIREIQAINADPNIAGRMMALVEGGGTTRSARLLAQGGWNEVGRGAIEEGIRSLEEALKLSPENLKGIVFSRLADACMAAGDLRRAGECFAELRRLEPASSAPYLGLARIAVQEGDTAKARLLLASARAAGAAAVDADRVEAEALLAEGKQEQAEGVLERILASDPRDWPTWAMLLDVAVARENPALLRSCVDRLSKLEGADPYLFHVAKGYLAIAAGDPRSARNQFSMASDSRPAQVTVLETLLRLELAEGLPARAHANVRALLNADPGNAFGHYVVGTIQIGDKRYDEAEVSLRRSLAAARTPEALNNLAWVLQIGGRFAEAEGLAREGLKLAPSSPNLLDTLGVVMLGTGREEEAYAFFTQAVALEPSDVEPYVNLAEMELKNGRPDRAVELCDQAVRRLRPRERSMERTVRNLKKKAERAAGK